MDQRHARRKEMDKVNYQKRWVGQELDDPVVRKKFIRHLKKWHNEFAMSSVAA